MPWEVAFHDAYVAELGNVPARVRIKVLAMANLLREFGPHLHRPHCDTLHGSRHTNMKELRFTVPDGEWRVAYAFDPHRCAVLLVGGSKSGVSQDRFYRALTAIADERFDEHLEGLG